MVFFPNCKINLGLYVSGKLPNGYHTIETCFYPIALHDVLEIVALPNTTQVSLSLSGIAIDQTTNNSCLNAYALLKREFPELTPVQMYLHKAIPAGGGLGGGSADGAFTLRMLNQKFGLHLSDGKLMEYAAQLGSDCAFFIKGAPCLASGRGEILAPFPLDLSEYKIVLVNPGLHVNTGWAYTQIEIEKPALPLAVILKLPVEEWKEHLLNVFETPIFQTYPEIQKIKEMLYENGAVYAAMAGSGATVYGLFKKLDRVTFPFPPHYLVKEC